MDITPTVQTSLSTSGSASLNNRKRAAPAKQAEEQPTQERIQQALNRVSDIRQQLGKRA
jgi:hypothetical protein